MLEKIAHWSQIVSGIVLLAGVVLVVEQLRQADRLTGAELTNQYLLQLSAQAATLSGENPAAALARMCDPDADLNAEDAHVLHAIFLSRLYQAYATTATSEAMDVGVAGIDLAEQRFAEQLVLVAGHPQGRAWLETVGLPEPIMERLRTSPFWTSNCDPVGPMEAILSADRTLKATMRAGEP